MSTDTDIYTDRYTDTDTDTVINLKVKVMECMHGYIAIYKGNDFEFQGHAIEVENVNYNHWIPRPRNYTNREDQNPGAVATTLIGCKRDRNSK